jgi:DNA-binding FadR family transcriptional regulator
MSQNKGISYLQPVKIQSTDMLVLEALAGYVSQAGLGVGDRLPSERELAEQLEVSRNTVREAVKRWEAIGVVQRRAGAGTFLTSEIKPGDTYFSYAVQNDVEHMLHSVELRRILETDACALAAQRATKDDIKKIRHCIEEIEQCYERAEVGGKQDWNFHCSIYRATHNPMFEQLVDGLYAAFHAFLDAPEEHQLALSSVKEHRALFEAIAAGDSSLARSICHDILDVIEHDMRQLAEDSK